LQPGVAVGIAEACERRVSSAIRIETWLSLAARHQFVMSGFDVRRHEVHPHSEPGVPSVIPVPMVIEQAEPGGVI
jgi:hypothetical protein